jgi:hypothetical protein
VEEKKKEDIPKTSKRGGWGIAEGMTYREVLAEKTVQHRKGNEPQL